MSVLRNALDFLGEFGIFDVVLPFLLVFAVVFGILEKTRLFGEEKLGEHSYPKKNLDAIVALVFAMLVVAATKIVGVINDALPKISLLIVVSLSFLLMIGIFMSSENPLFENLKGGWTVFLMILMFVAVILIFLSSIPADENQSWLEYALKYVTNYWDGTVVGSIILLIVVIGAIVYITSGKEKGKD